MWRDDPEIREDVVEGRRPGSRRRDADRGSGRSGAEQALRELHEVGSAPRRGLEARLLALLGVGCRRLDLPIGVVSRVREGRYEVVVVRPSGSGLHAGDVLPLEEMYCRRTLGAEEPVAIVHAGGSPWRHPCHERFGIEAYLGARLVVGDGVYGTLSFWDTEPRSRGFDDAQIDLLHLITSCVAREIEREREIRMERTLAATGRVLAVSLDAAAIASGVAKGLVPDVVDGCVVLGRDREEVDGFRVLASSGSGGILTEVLAEVCRQRVERRLAEGMLREPELSPMPAELVTPTLPEAGDSDVPHRVRVATLAIVPLSTRASTFGALCLLGARAAVKDNLERPEVLLRVGDPVSRAFRNATLHRQALDAVTTRDQMLMTVCHDLRTPLTAITMFAHLARRGVARGQAVEKTEEQLDSITRIVGGADRLIQDLLDVARLEKGRVRLSPRRLSVPELVGEIAETLEPVVGEKRVTLEWELPEGIPPIRGDRDRILQLLQNLLGNAVAHTPEGGRVRLVAEVADADHVLISVEDTGPGIAREDQERVFEPFWRGGGSRSGGAGLGLAIARGIVERHGGRLWVESEHRGGARFSFTLPVWQGPRLAG